MRVETFPASGPLRLELSIPAGEIEVEAASVTEAVVELETVSGNEAAVEEAQVELRGDELTVKVKRSKAEVRLRVQAPEGSALRAKTASGDLRSRGRLGAAEVKSASGDVALELVESLDAKVASCDVEVGRVDGEAHVDNASGDDTQAVLAGAASYSLLFLILLWEALRGRSVVAPDAVAVASLTVWVSVTALTLGWISVRSRGALPVEPDRMAT